MNTKTIIAFVLGLLLGALLVYFMFCKPPIDKESLTEADILNSAAYKNPDPKSLLEPHDFFNKYKTQIENPKGVFTGLKVEGKYLRQLVRATAFKNNYYIAIGYDEQRNKKLLVACEPKEDGVWRQGKEEEDFKWEEGDDAETPGKPNIDTASTYYKQFNKSDYIFTIEKDPRTQSYILKKEAWHNHYVTTDPKDDWFNKVFKAIAPGTSAYAGSVCVCKTCCGTTQSGLNAAQN